jgi:hypothetical protein
VEVGRSWWEGGYGRYGGSGLTRSYGRVNLCPDCAEDRDRADAASRRLLMAAALVLAGGFLLYVLVVCAGTLASRVP